MLDNRIKKLIATFLIFSQLAFFPLVTFADILGIQGSNPAIPMYVSNSITPEVDAPIFAAISGASAANQSCAVADQAYSVGDTVAQFGFSGLSLIGGSPLLTTQLTAKITKLEGFIACRQAVLATLEGIVTPDLITAQPKQTVYNAATAAITSMKAKEDSLKAQLADATQGFWKTLLVSVLLQTSKAVADTLVAKLVNNYKISNLKQYADSAATLMYDNQFIRENFPNAQDQLMARAILTNPAFRSQIQPSIFVAANAALGYNPNAINPASPNFYGQMAAMGSPSANPYYLQTAYVGGVDQSHAAAMATAQQQISQGSGYKAPVNCAGTLTQQRQVDAQYQALQTQAQNRSALLASLTAAVQSGQKVSASDLAKAQADDNAAQLALANAPQAVMSSSGSTSTNPAIIMCEAISSPAVLVNQGIDALFKAVGGNLTQYNSNNLPGYINIISGIASQIGTSMVLGGVGAGASSALLNENKAVAATAALAASTNSAANGSNTNLDGSSNFVIGIYPSSGNSTLVNWQVITANLPTASYTTVTGPGAPTGHLPLTGNITVSPTVNTSYVLTVFNAAGKSLGNTNMNVFVDTSSSQSFNYNPNAPAVAGAFTRHPFQASESGAGFTIRPVIATRGPVAQLSIR
jgi:hypothetical protein